MSLSEEQIKNTIDPRALTIGLGAVGALYLILIIYSFITSPSLLKQAETKAPKRIITIETAEQKPLPSLIKKSETNTHQEEPKDKNITTSSAPQSSKVTTPFDPVKPMKGFYEQTDNGYLPQKNADGLSPFDAYRRTVASVNPEHKKIAIALTDIGLSEKMSKSAVIDLPAEISLILSPYANQPQKWQSSISAHGHELWLSIPIEDKYYPMSEPGSQGLLSRAGYDKNKEHLIWSMTRTHGYTGIAMYSDEAFSNARNILKSLVSFVFKRGLGYLELNPQTPHSLDLFAAQLNTPYIKSTTQKGAVFSEYIDILEQKADNNSPLIATFPATPANIKAIKSWAETLEQKSITLLPLSSVYAAPQTKPLEQVTQDTKEEQIIPSEQLSNKDHELHATDQHEPETNH